MHRPNTRQGETNHFSWVQHQNIEHLGAVVSHLTFTSQRSEREPKRPLYVFICNEKTASAKAKPLQVCKPCSSSHILRPGAAMCQARSLCYRVILEVMFVAPTVFLLLCVDTATVLSVISLKLHDFISGHLWWSKFALDQWYLLRVILSRASCERFICQKLLTKQS